MPTKKQCRILEAARTTLNHPPIPPDEQRHLPTDEQRRILEAARATLNRRPEPPDEPVAQPVCYKTHWPAPADPPPEPEPPRLTEGMLQRQRQAEAAQSSDSWNQWLDTRLNAALAEERKTICAIIAESLAEFVGRAVAKERGNFYSQIRELKTETIKLETALEHLHGLLALERSRTYDLPALPRRSDIN
jgi:hypothetical protein